MSITHAFVSAKSDANDASVVRPSDWNADHTGTIAASAVTIVDAGSHFTGTDVEAALQELEGTWHKVTDPSTGWLLSKTNWVGADAWEAETDFSSYVPAGTKAIRVGVYVVNAVQSWRTYWRKSGDTNISNTPNASSEYSHLLNGCDALGGLQFQSVIWLSSDYKAQFAASNVNVDLYISYPLEYMT